MLEGTADLPRHDLCSKTQLAWEGTTDFGERNRFKMASPILEGIGDSRSRD